MSFGDVDSYMMQQERKIQRLNEAKNQHQNKHMNRYMGTY